MKFLLDENLPKNLKVEFGGIHEVYTVRDLKWKGKKNGELLGLMTFHGFNALVTIDKNLPKQQNISRFPITVFVLNAPNNKIETLRPYIAKLIETVAAAIEQGVLEINLN